MCLGWIRMPFYHRRDVWKSVDSKAAIDASNIARHSQRIEVDKECYRVDKFVQMVSYQLGNWEGNNYFIY